MNLLCIIVLHKKGEKMEKIELCGMFVGGKTGIVRVNSDPIQAKNFCISYVDSYDSRRYLLNYSIYSKQILNV